jgi:single-stranded-DNA-specific exonuclease
MSGFDKNINQHKDLLVERSLRGRDWRLDGGDQRMAAAISQHFSISEIAGRILASRGFDLDSVASFLEPSLRESLPDPSRLLDMDKAVKHLAKAIMAADKIAVFGDYDVDGATSSAVLIRYFKAIGVPLTCYIPDRLSEGYGPNEAALLKLQSSGVKTVITVDCGTLSYQPLAAAKKAGLDVIVVDHHKAETTLPEALAVINPNRLDEPNDVVEEMGHMAAVGVAFLLIVALNRTLRGLNYFAAVDEPDLKQFLDLVALGTVCDVVPLKGVNRVLVTQGLKVMAQRRNVGLRALSDVSKIDAAPTAYHAGFQLGPRVNAGGRVGEAGLGAKLLSMEEGQAVEATEIAEHLDQLNDARKTIEAQVLEEAMAMAEGEMGIRGEVGDIVFVAGKSWHPGVIGIVASRLKERFNRPTFILAIEDGLAKCSARGISGVDIGSAVIEAMHKGLLIAGGGHAMAAGLSVDEEKLDALKDFLTNWLAPSVAIAKTTQQFKIDGAITTGGATLELINDLDKLAPFGAGNPTPSFVILDAKIVMAKVVGANHLKLVMMGDDGVRVEGIAFQAMDDSWGQVLLKSVGEKFHFAGKLKLNKWHGDGRVEMTIEDAAKL